MTDEERFHNAIVTLVTTGGYYEIAGDKLFPNHLDQDSEYPMSRYQINNNDPLNTKDGVAGEFIDVIISHFSDSKTEVTRMHGAVRNDLEGFSGQVEGLAIDDIRLFNATDRFEPDNQVYHYFSEYRFFVNKPIPI